MKNVTIFLVGGCAACAILGECMGWRDVVATSTLGAGAVLLLSIVLVRRDCRRPRGAADDDYGHQMSPRYCWRDTGLYGRGVAVTHCWAAQIEFLKAECARLTAQLAATTGALASAEVAIETLEARVEAAERDIAAATARAGEAVPAEVVEAAREVRRLTVAATDGPWESAWNEPESDVDDGVVIRATKGAGSSSILGDAVVGLVYWDGELIGCLESDAAFIAAARTLAPLLAEWVLRAGGGR